MTEEDVAVEKLDIFDRQHVTVTNGREATHGDFCETARTATALRAAMADGYNWEELSPVMREALTMIATKIARVLSGDSRCRDHWDDIGGYAHLAAEACPK